jgi:hypothetical protein
MTPQQQRWCWLAVFALLLPGIFWGLPSAISPQVDSPVPLGSLQFFADRRAASNVTYPPFHQILLLPVLGLWLAAHWLLGGISKLSSAWPYGFHDVSSVFSQLMALTNLVSSLMAVGLLRCAYALTEERRRIWAWFAILFFATNGVFAYYGRVGNLDMPYNFWIAVMMLGLWRHLTQPVAARRWTQPLWWSAAAGAFAIGSKDQAVGVVIGAGLLLLLFDPARPGSEGGVGWPARLRQTAWFGAVLLGAYGLTSILPHPLRWWNHALFVTSPHAPTPIPATVWGQWLIFQHTLRRLEDTYSWPFLALAAWGAWCLYRDHRRKFWFLIVPCLTYYAVIIAKTRVAYPRFMLTFALVLFVCLCHAAGDLAGRLPRLPRWAWPAALATMLLWNGWWSYAPVTYAQVFDMKRQLAADLPGLLPAGQPLVLSRMQGHNFPGAGVYERVPLMMIPGDPIIPTSRHTAGPLKPFQPDAQYYLLGTGGAGLPWHAPIPHPPLSGELVRRWRYPDWVRDRVQAPCLYEFELYRRTGPWPENYVAPEAPPPDNPG